MNYFPYHEMDIMHMVDYYEKRLNIPSKLKLMREKMELSQSQLALNADVPLRTIKSYEQKTVDISKAQIENIYKVARELYCKNLYHYMIKTIFKKFFSNTHLKKG